MSTTKDVGIRHCDTERPVIRFNPKKVSLVTGSSAGGPLDAVEPVRGGIFGLEVGLKYVLYMICDGCLLIVSAASIQDVSTLRVVHGIRVVSHWWRIGKQAQDTSSIPSTFMMRPSPGEGHLSRELLDRQSTVTSISVQHK